MKLKARRDTKLYIKGSDEFYLVKQPDTVEINLEDFDRVDEKQIEKDCRELWSDRIEYDKDSFRYFCHTCGEELSDLKKDHLVDANKIVELPLKLAGDNSYCGSLEIICETIDELIDYLEDKS